MSWQPIPSVNEPHYLDTNLNQIQKCVNWYHEKTPSGLVLMSLQGYQTKGTVANNAACRGAKFDVVSNRIYSANGNKIYAIDGGASSLALTGTLATSSGPVIMASGLSQIMLVDGTYGYIIDSGRTAVTRITDSNFPASPISCACFNGQFLVLNGLTDRWYMSAVDDGLTWTPIISGRAITNGDALVHIEVVKDVVYFIGAYSIEPWYASSVDPFLQPITGSVHPVGIADRLVMARLDDSLFFYGASEKGRGAFWTINNGQLERISTPYIEDKVGDWTVGAGYSVRSSAYINDGRRFFEIYNDSMSTSQFPAWLYSPDTGTWSESTLDRNLYTVVNLSGAGVPPLGLSKDNGKVYWLGTNAVPFNSFDGGGIARTLDFKVDGGMSRTINQGLRFEFEAQHDSSISYTFSFILQKSDDAGRTFDTGITISKSITNGTSAQQVTVITPPMGSFKAGRVYRITFNTDPAARIILRRAEGLIQVGRF